jgi:hypothetical protein
LISPILKYNYFNLNLYLTDVLQTLAFNLIESKDSIKYLIFFKKNKDMDKDLCDSNFVLILTGMANLFNP